MGGAEYLQVWKMAWTCCPAAGKSMLQKSRERSKAKKYLNRNLTAGHVIPNEHYLERAGLRGRKMWLCSCFIFLLFIFAVAHLAVTCLILSILQFGSAGFPYFVFRGATTVWPQGGNLSNVTIATPYGINGFETTTLALAADEGAELRAEAHCGARCAASVSLSNSAVNFRTAASLNIRGRNGEEILFANSSRLQITAVSALGGMTTTQLTSTTVSGVSQISTGQELRLLGAGGVTVSGSVVSITSNTAINLSAQRLRLNGNRGILLPGLGDSSQSSSSYHLCATANGTLFTVPANPQRCLGA